MHPALAEASTDHPNDLKTKLGEIRIAIDHNEHMRRIERVLSIGLPSLAELRDAYLGSHMTIVGSGPSAADTVKKIPKGSFVCAVNAAHDWIVSKGIIPKFAVMMDPNPWVATYQTPRKDVTYILGTTCHPSVWNKFLQAGIVPYVTVPMLGDKDHELIVERFPDHFFNFVGGGVTTGIRSVPLMAGLGASIIDMHGFDSCYAPKTDIGGILYAHHKPATHHDARELTVQSRATKDNFFCRSNAAMARQILSFQALCASLSDYAVNADIQSWDGKAYAARDADLRLRVWGDGAIPWMAWKDGTGANRFLHAEPHLMEEKYGDSPMWDYHRNRAFVPYAVEWEDDACTRLN